MRKIIILSALIICTIGIIVIFTIPTSNNYDTDINKEVYYKENNITSHQKRNGYLIAEKNTQKSLLKRSNIKRHIPKQKNTYSINNHKLLTIRNNEQSHLIGRLITDNSNMSNNSFVNKKIVVNNENSNITIQNFGTKGNGSFNSLQKSDESNIAMQFGFADLNQLNNPGKTPLGNEAVLILCAFIFIIYKKNN